MSNKFKWNIHYKYYIISNPYGLYLFSYSCWLARIPFYATVLGPVSISLVVNSVVFGLVINELRQMGTHQMDKSERSMILSRLRGAIGIMFLLGLTWMFAFFSVGPAGRNNNLLLHCLHSKKKYYCKRSLKSRHDYPKIAAMKSLKWVTSGHNSPRIWHRHSDDPESRHCNDFLFCVA